jgi:hypothetical protein
MLVRKDGPVCREKYGARRVVDVIKPLPQLTG